MTSGIIVIFQEAAPSEVAPLGLLRTGVGNTVPCVPASVSAFFGETTLGNIFSPSFLAVIIIYDLQWRTA